MARIVLLRWQPVKADAQRAANGMWSRISSHRAWVKFIDRRGVLAHYALELHDPPPINLGDDRGAIFGSLFSKAAPGSPRVKELARATIESLVDEGGNSLMRDYWGAWLALIQDRGKDFLCALRDPTGAGPAYEGGDEQVRIICTHPSDYVRMVDGCEPDMEVLAASIVSPSLITPRTAIVGLREIFPGERLTLPREAGIVRRELLWRPLAQGEQISADDFHAAATQLRETVNSCATSWAIDYPRIVHRLSGGLDSSIVLSALREAEGSDVVALNEYAKGAPEGDERAIARVSAKKFNVPLIEVAMSPAQVDWSRLLNLELGARPMRQILSLADDTVCDAIGAIDEHALVTSGQGGDQVFHRSHLPFMAADAWTDRLPLNAVLSVVLDTARLGRRNAWEVLGTVLSHGALRQKLPKGGIAARVAMFDAGNGEPAALALDASHPWRAELRGLSPARALRVGLIADLQNYRQNDAIASRFAKAQVLTSQPIIEFCLRVPPYVMTLGGRDRSLVRTAFAGVLPREVLARASKGATTRYHAEVTHRHLPWLRDLLVGGEAEGAGLLNKAALAGTLRQGEITSAPHNAALVTCLLVELWLRRFKAIKQEVERGVAT